MASEYPIELPLFRSERDSEAALVARAAAGDHDAYAALVRPHEHVAYRVAVSITGWNADAQEAVQNAYVKAYRSLRRFRRDAAFKPWLLGSSSTRHATCGGPSSVTSGSPSGRPSSTTRPRPARTRRCSRGRRSRLFVALAELSEPDRLVVALRYFAQLPDAEAAALAGVSAGAYRVRLVRARRRLEALLEDADV